MTLPNAALRSVNLFPLYSPYRLLRIDCMTRMCYARREGCCGMETGRSGRVLPCGENRRTHAEDRKQAPVSRRYGRRSGSLIPPCYRGLPS